MKRIVVLISGRGSNMRAIADACVDECWPAEVTAVISNRADADGLIDARERGIATEVVDHKAYADRDGFDRALAHAIDQHRADVVAMAGFMRIVGGEFTRRYAQRMLNIHPSLLPAFSGLSTHRRAIESGCTLAGATVHFVTAALDHGPIVIQAAVPLAPDDTEDTLAARVLEREHVIYPRALRWLLDGRLRIEGQRVRQLDGQAQWLL
jgi:phosphoribosylglycinamide formyltransferase 1